MTANPFYGCFLGGVPVCCDGGGGGAPNVGYEAYRTTNLSIAPTVETLINWNSKAFENPVGVFNLTTDRFTAPTEGRYSFTGGIKLDTAAAGSVYLRIYRGANFVTEQSVYSNVANTLSPSVSAILWLTAGQTVEARVFQNTGFFSTLQGCGNLFAGAQIFEV